MTTSLPVLRAAASALLRARDRIHLAGRVVHAHAGLVAPSPPAAESPPGGGRRSKRAADGGPASAATSRAWPRSWSCPSPAGRASGSRAAARAVSCSPPLASPKSASSSSRTILTTCWLGVRLLSTAWSIARSRTRSMNALTTLKLTSASSSARRISRSAASTVVSVSRVSPFSD